MAYLTSEYPAASHTFIRREVAALRRLGLDIETFSVRRPTSRRLGHEDVAEEQRTTYLLPAKASRLAAGHIHALVRRPIPYLRTLRLALRHRPPGLRGFAWSLFHFAEAMLLANELDRQGMQHLHNHFANSAATVGFLATRYLAMPWSLTLHGISETDYPAGLTLAQKIRGADFVACASWFGRAQAMRMTPSEHWNKMLIVRCGLLLEDLPVRASQAAGTRLLCVGRLSPEKGIVGLLTAIHMLRRRDVPVLLDVVGDGPDRSNIERAIASLQLQDCVRLRGQLTETETLQAIAQADLFVLPSFMEGLPVVLMEAMAIGVPVIAPRVAGIPELVEDGSGGLLFHPSNWADLADQIERMLAQPELQASFTARARLKIEEEFEISRAVKPLASRLAPGLPGRSTVGDQH